MNGIKILLGSYFENDRDYNLYVDLKLNNQHSDKEFIFDTTGNRIDVDEKQSCFSIVFSVYDKKRRDVVFSTPGYVNSDYDFYDRFENCNYPNLFHVLNELGRDFHLNDLRAGTPKQEAILKQDERWVDYDSAVQILTECNMLTDPEHNYRYGSAWTLRAIPNNVIEFINEVIECVQKQDLEQDLEVISSLNQKIMNNNNMIDLFEYREHGVDISDLVQKEQNKLNSCKLKSSC